MGLTRETEQGWHPATQRGGWHLARSFPSLSVLGNLTSFFLRPQGSLLYPLCGSSSGPAPRPWVENRWAGGLQEEWSRVTMATRKTGALWLLSPSPAGHGEAASLSPTSSPLHSSLSSLSRLSHALCPWPNFPRPRIPAPFLAQHLIQLLCLSHFLAGPQNQTQVQISTPPLTS